MRIPYRWSQKCRRRSCPRRQLLVYSSITPLSFNGFNVAVSSAWGLHIPVRARMTAAALPSWTPNVPLRILPAMAAPPFSGVGIRHPVFARLRIVESIFRPRLPGAFGPFGSHRHQHRRCPQLLSRSILRPLAHAAEVTDRIAEGDLTSAVPSSAAGSRDELQALLVRLGGMQSRLGALVVGMRQASTSVA
eukprot:gene44700-55622_t